MTISHFNLANLRHPAARICPFAILVAVGGSVSAENIAVPSGQPLSFLQFISEEDGDLVRFRFLAPDIGAGMTYSDVFPDFQVVCDQQVMPVLAANDLNPRQIVLSMSAVDIPFRRVMVGVMPVVPV